MDIELFLNIRKRFNNWWLLDAEKIVRQNEDIPREDDARMGGAKWPGFCTTKTGLKKTRPDLDSRGLGSD